MGRRARSTVEADYSLHVWGPRFAAVLESVVGERRTPLGWNER